MWMSQIPNNFQQHYVARVAQLVCDLKVVDRRGIMVELARQHDDFQGSLPHKKQTKTIRRLELQIKEHLASTKAANAEYQLHCGELFTMIKAENVMDQVHAANEATILHQDIAGLQAGMEELRTLHVQLAEDSCRLIDYQLQTMLIKEAQDDTAQKLKTKILKEDPPVSRSMLEEMFGEWTTRFLAQLNDDMPTKQHNDLRSILAPLLSDLDGVVLSMMGQLKVVTMSHNEQARNATVSIYQLNETNVK